MNSVLAVADSIVHIVMLAVLIGGIGFSALLIHEQVHLIRESLTTPTRKDPS